MEMSIKSILHKYMDGNYKDPLIDQLVENRESLSDE